MKKKQKTKRRKVKRIKINNLKNKNNKIGKKYLMILLHNCQKTTSVSNAKEK